MLIGCLGGGQLGRMLGLAALPLDIRLRVFDPDPSACAAHVAEHVRGEWADRAALERFCSGLDCCTFEFENVPLDTLEFVAARVPMRPGANSLSTGQDRSGEKAAFAKVGFNVPPHALVQNASELPNALDAVGVPGVLKARRGGYDGKGQAVIRDPALAEAAFTSLGSRPAVYEAFVPFVRELSIIACRGMDGSIVHYPIAENVHHQGILHVSIANTPVTPHIAQQARDHITTLLSALGHIGILAIEMFEVATSTGPVLAPNEMAPRVHNTGHWSIEGSVTSQFENHMRAVAGLPLGSAAMAANASHAAMVNLIGDMPQSALLAQDLLREPGAHLHLYGKAPRQGRKIGHVTLVGGPEIMAQAQHLAERWKPC